MLLQHTKMFKSLWPVRRYLDIADQPNIVSIYVEEWTFISDLSHTVIQVEYIITNEAGESEKSEVEQKGKK